MLNKIRYYVPKEELKSTYAIFSSHIWCMAVKSGNKAVALMMKKYLNCKIEPCEL